MSFVCSPYYRGSRTKTAVVDSSLQLRIFAKTLGTASPFKLPSQCKTCSPAPLLKLIWARQQSRKKERKNIYFSSDTNLQRNRLNGIEQELRDWTGY
jgi:hypothetical protein